MTNEQEKLTICPNIALSPFDQIGKVDWKCQHHGDSRFMWACIDCVKEQLVREYERGKKEAAKPDESETIKELRETINKVHERTSTYYREKCDLEKQLASERKRGEQNFQSRCDLEKDYATLKQRFAEARDQLEVAHRIVNSLQLNRIYSPSLQQALKDWEAL